LIDRKRCSAGVEFFRQGDAAKKGWLAFSTESQPTFFAFILLVYFTRKIGFVK